MAHTWPLVGRDDELMRLGEAIDARAAGVVLAEREVAARGATSREMAEELFVSARTVENHLQRAYEKLGVRSRPELAEVLRISAPVTL